MLSFGVSFILVTKGETSSLLTLTGVIIGFGTLVISLSSPIFLLITT